jgi:hypothetical protein
MNNKEINKLLCKHRGDKTKFAKYLVCPVSTLNDRLKSDKLKDNLYSAYKVFLVEQKEQDIWKDVSDHITKKHHLLRTKRL